MKKLFYYLIIFLIIPFQFTNAQNNALTLSLDELMINSNMGLGTINVTVECWVNIPSVSEKGAFINVGNGSSGYGIGVGNGTWDSDGNELIIIYNEINWFPTGINIGTGWHHIAFTIDAFSTARAFLDGKLVYTKNGFNAVSPANTVYIGSGGGGRNLSNGTMDEVRLWNIDRAEAEIRADMYKELVPADEANLVGYYKFNETSGQILSDETSNNNDGTLSAGINFTDHGIPSVAFFGPKKAMRFNTDDYVSISSIFGLGTTSVTLECWINLNSTSQKGAFVHIGNHNFGYGMGVGNSEWDNNGNQILILFDQSRWIPTGTNIGTGWHHVVLILDSNSDPIVYLDGELVYSDTGQSDPINPVSNSSIGSSQGGSRNLSDGIIDEVRIWNDIRSQSEIQQNMLKTLTGNEDNLVAYYKLDGNVVVDLSGNGNDGIIGGDGDESVTSTAFNSWLNTNSTSWETATNWSLGSLPSPTDNVGISNQNTNPVVSSTANCNDLLIEPGASLSLNDGASFINSGNLYIIGDFILKKSLTNDSKWHLISPPNNNTTANLFFGDYLQNWNESTGLWEQIDDENTTLTPVTAYGFFGTHAKASYSFTGDPNDGDQSISLTTSGSGGSYNKANAVGNPYPSSIDWDLVSGYGAKYTWNGTAYVAYPATGGFGLGSR
ncbi:LamG domain-containing protein, partial [Lentimicrobium sp. S6]|uniref:LamG domain-containing protein n=1 Tax=Lentimicrobium sp. S6 TaxID=2735872 RepID=UPI001552A191